MRRAIAAGVVEDMTITLSRVSGSLLDWVYLVR